MNKTRKKSEKEIKILDILGLLASGYRLSYRLNNNKIIQDKELSELINLNNLIRANAKDDTFIKIITTPLGKPVYIDNANDLNNKPISVTTSIPLFHGNLNYNQNVHEVSVKFNPVNEHELSNFLARLYSINNYEDLNYSTRMRAIESWGMSLVNALDDLRFFDLEINSLISYYEILLLANSIDCKITYKDYSPHYGYLDVGNNLSDEGLAQKIFDISTTYASIAQSKNKDIAPLLLLGHRTYASIKMDWASMLYLIGNEIINFNTEHLVKIKDKIKSEFSLNFPVLKELFEL